MILQGKAIFTCPKTGKEVILHIDCLNPDGKGNQCIFFRHWGGWHSAHPTIGCDYKQEQQTEEKKHEEEHIDQETEDERAWRDPQFIEDEE